MKCADARELLSAYVDDMLSDSERTALEEHLRICATCAHELAELRQTIAALATLPEVEPPAEFRQQLRQRLDRLAAADQPTSAKTRRGFRLAWLRPRGAVAAVLVGVLIFASGYGTSYVGTLRLGKSAAPDAGQRGLLTTQGVTPNGSGSGAPLTSSAPPAADSTATMMAKGITGQPAADGQKIIRNGELQMAVPDLRQAQDKVVNTVKEALGYVESSSIQERPTEGKPIAYLTLRVPATNFDGLLAVIRPLGTVRVENTSAVDVTLQYTDADARVKNLKVQEERLRELLTKAVNIDETLRIENELNRLRTEIDSTTVYLRQLSTGIEYATLSLTLEQDSAAIAVGPSQSLLGRFTGAFLNSLRAFGRLLIQGIIGIGTILPVLIILGLLILIIRPQRWLKRRNREQ